MIAVLRNSLRTPLVVLCFSFVFSSNAFTQGVDFVEITRTDNPPQYADYVGLVTTTYVERWEYTPNVEFNGQQVLKLERLGGEEEPTESITVLYMLFDETALQFAGLDFKLEFGGQDFPVSLTFDPLVELDRNIQAGDQIEQSGSTLVSLGLLQVNVQYTVFYEFLAVEDIETPLGTFADVVKVRSDKTFSIPGVEEVLQTIEWYHPAVGLVQLESLDSGQIIQLKSINPPITQVDNWKEHWQ